MTESTVKKDSMRDFITAWRTATPTVKYTEVKTLQDTITWDRRFHEAGYYWVEVSNAFERWEDIQDWCTNQYGKDHYAWVGSVFWFETKQDAMLFALRWS